MMSKQERENVEAMTRGLEALPKAVGVMILTPMAAGLFFAVYAVMCAVRGGIFTDFQSQYVMVSLLIVLGITLVSRHYGDKLILKITGQYNDTTLLRGMAQPKLGLRDRVKQFIPTMSAWKWLLLLWVIANALDCLSTYLALQQGASEANPTARGADNMYISKWIGVAVLTAMACFFQWKGALKLLTVTMWLVAFGNFAVLGMYMVQPSLGDYSVDVTMPAFLIQLSKTVVIAAILLWHREIWEAFKKGYARVKGH